MDHSQIMLENPWFKQKDSPEDEMEKLANSKVSKVSFDAQDNRSYYRIRHRLISIHHRLLSLGHDPILGLISLECKDILTGKMTTIDKTKVCVAG